MGPELRDPVGEVRLALLDFKKRYNGEGLIERHSDQTLAAVRSAFTVVVEATAWAQASRHGGH